MEQKKQIEVEYRALLTRTQYEDLISFLNENAEDLGEDDKRVHFFVFPDKMLKVTHNISQQSAKVTLKLNRIGKGSMFEEIEVPIAESDVEKMAELFKSFGFEHLLEPIVKRHNYLYEGVELAIKFSESWQYHAELEIIISDPKDHPAAEKTIHSVAHKLGIKILTEEELGDLVEKIESDYKVKNIQ